MQNIKLNLLFALTIALLFNLNTNAQCADLYIAGLIDGPLSGGTPKAVQFCANANIADLSIYGFGSANNGGGTDGQEFAFPSVSLNAGDCVWVASESTNFLAYFGFEPCSTDNASNINGNDAIELFCNGNVVDLYGQINVNGTGTIWAYTDAWASALDSIPSATFDSSEWNILPINSLDGETSNAIAQNPYPNATQTNECGQQNCTITNVFISNAYCNEQLDNTFTYEVNYTALNLSSPNDTVVIFDAVSNTILATSTSSPATLSIGYLFGTECLEIVVYDKADPTCASDTVGFAAYCFGVNCANAGDLIITEIMSNPANANDSNGEYFELYNTTNFEINLAGYFLTDNGSNQHVIESCVFVQPNDYVVLGIEGDATENGGIEIDYEYSSFSLSNGDDEIILNCINEVIDSVAYDGSFPLIAGTSMELCADSLSATANDNAASWIASATTIPNGDFGSPGMANGACVSTCPQFLILSGVSASGIFEADEYIESTASINATTNGDVSYFAGNISGEYIELQVGFEATGDFNFEAINMGCE